MLLAAYILCAIVIALHLAFAALEMVLWKTKAPKVFGITSEFARNTAALASNQGLYNSFLAAALILGFFWSPFMFYGLGCVIIAGIWGAITVNKRIFIVQALPAIAALALFWLAQ